MWCCVSLSVLILTSALLVQPRTVHHIHHGVERARTWDDVWLVHLTNKTQPQVMSLKVKDYKQRNILLDLSSFIFEKSNYFVDQIFFDTYSRRCKLFVTGVCF